MKTRSKSICTLLAVAWVFLLGELTIELSLGIGSSRAMRLLASLVHPQRLTVSCDSVPGLCVPKPLLYGPHWVLHEPHTCKAGVDTCVVTIWEFK